MHIATRLKPVWGVYLQGTTRSIGFVYGNVYFAQQITACLYFWLIVCQLPNDHQSDHHIIQNDIVCCHQTRLRAAAAAAAPPPNVDTLWNEAQIAILLRY